MKNTCIILLLTIGLLLSTSNSYAQEDSEEIYRTVKDNPFNIPKLYIDISPFIYNMQWNQNLSFGVKANYFLNEKTVLRGQVELQYPKASFFTFMDWLYDIDYLYPLHNEMVADLGINIPINDAVRDEHYLRAVRTYSSQYGGNVYYSNSWTSDKLKHRRLCAIRVGGITYRSNFFLPENETLITTDGTEFITLGKSAYDSPGIVKYANIEYSMLNDGNNSKKYSDVNGRVRTISDFYGVYLGYASSDIVNRITFVKDYGTSGQTSYKTFYADILIGKTIIKPFDFYLPNANATVYGEEISSVLGEFVVNQDATNIKQNNFGFRLGWEYRVPLKSKFVEFERRNKIIEKPAYFTFYHEFGLYPGFGILNNLYYKMGMSMELNFF
ncbi:MAG: hypothetical protein C0596_09115 [Marinilabiliales bacterium]|nr:MAG: hypothetical protein C0596_09115 [Marinilabiliales bacterium]